MNDVSNNINFAKTPTIMKTRIILLCLSFHVITFAALGQKYPVDTIPAIYDLIEEVDTAIINRHVQHLQDFVTRDCFSPQAVDAQNWIYDQFESYGLDVELQDFTVWGQESSDNVIATLTGSLYPDEYVIVGGHYDSFATPLEAPGADDNASGTSGVMEIARILSNYEFERTLVFCAWSGEEYGLHGSEAYASNAAALGMNILGYFNLDMIGYLEPGHTTIKTSLFYPNTAEQLASFYKDVCAIYLPDFEINDGEYIGGDSDHSSFNNNGYMGIFPFEDEDYYSPYIHSLDDVVGLSYNNPEQAKVFTQASLASAVTLAGWHDPTGIGDSQTQRMLSVVYPNPTSGKIHVSIPTNADKSYYSVTTIDGRSLITGFLSNNQEIDLSTLSDGFYFFHVKNSDLEDTHKLMIKK
ncbi:MAG: M28 family peptidase [Bacteroidetes bacterium]|nr:M28 family peptidase [Bacteroidota bacterium]